MEFATIALLLAGAFFAGLVDAIVGGGGLIQIPLLFTALPAAPPATVFGTNKIAAVFGTAFAASRYARRIEVPWRLALPSAVAAFAASYAGALSVALLPKEWLRPLVLLLLVGVAVHTFLRKDFGTASAARSARRWDPLLAAALGAVLGFYDGFFGPGTGSFLLFLLVRLFALDFLRASASAKFINAATNLGALAYFVPAGQALWQLGLLMAVSNIAGAWVGAHLAIARGAAFVRKVFLGVVTVLIARFAWDTFA
jgi:hypothetical protein